jgi:hypothetical protein
MGRGRAAGEAGVGWYDAGAASCRRAAARQEGKGKEAAGPPCRWGRTGGGRGGAAARAGAAPARRPRWPRSRQSQTPRRGCCSARPVRGAQGGQGRAGRASRAAPGCAAGPARGEAGRVALYQATQRSPPPRTAPPPAPGKARAFLLPSPTHYPAHPPPATQHPHPAHALPAALHPCPAHCPAQRRPAPAWWLASSMKRYTRSGWPRSAGGQGGRRAWCWLCSTSRQRGAGVVVPSCCVDRCSRQRSRQGSVCGRCAAGAARPGSGAGRRGWRGQGRRRARGGARVRAARCRPHRWPARRAPCR